MQTKADVNSHKGSVKFTARLKSCKQTLRCPISKIFLRIYADHVASNDTQYGFKTAKLQLKVKRYLHAVPYY